MVNQWYSTNECDVNIHQERIQMNNEPKFHPNLKAIVFYNIYHSLEKHFSYSEILISLQAMYLNISVNQNFESNDL